MNMQLENRQEFFSLKRLSPIELEGCPIPRIVASGKTDLSIHTTCMTCTTFNVFTSRKTRTDRPM